MSLIRWATFLFCATAATLPGRAGLIPVVYQNALISGPTVVTPSTTLLSSGTPNIRLKFYVPDYQSIITLNSVNVTVTLFDDADGSGDNGEVMFVLNGAGLSNLQLGAFSNLNGYTLGSPYESNTSVQSGDLPDVLTEIQGDGYFFIRVNRNNPSSSDFYVKDATVTIDGELSSVPEPATLGAMGAGLAGLAILRRRRAKA